MTIKVSYSSEELDSFINAKQKVTAATEVEKTYDSWAETYEEDSEEQLGFTSPLECAKSVALFAKNDDNFLDVGCGTGLVSKHLNTLHGLRFGHSTGCDLSVKMLDIAKERKLYSEVSKLDIGALPWDLPSEFYDVVACNGVLIYVENVDCLDEFLRVTKKGGHICLMFRHDGYPIYESKVEALKAAGKWELVHKSESRRNFASSDSEAAAAILYNIWTFKKC
uniref:Williams-beuren syndrome chromosomal region 27 protein n=1 Tax=Tetraselmis sp. GSL018 TaxID=582737 RepID=A0A061RHB8_9CHLO|mmetsp:Transcript_10811/g.25699  ORF Transcript_10811/g.25699 Transcript_10811/m.25699 type:complete len:223 (+) Transcript_10811:189-857(+)|eukprot:CAMPEP_0177626014 /NCGR_PEP_ID=MMETSP0419_2-20121207/30420_1 /TAXON_ID=582737 /ORGANISM="Tetraselmis sp., Strain GSL018" /LENGTH=222 /DNA_ID=CAMNT_0019127025 /DNA_START=169 /DNA_END=837 /DNA_ORIENTATION=-